MELVTSFPLPPDYWNDLSIDEIERMNPPSIHSDASAFGLPSSVISDDLPSDNSIPCILPAEALIPIVGDILSSMGIRLDTIVVEYLELIQTAATEVAGKDNDAVQERLETVKIQISELHASIGRLRLHEVLIFSIFTALLFVDNYEL